MNNKTIFVGLSGGVDSALSAYLLKEQGYNVIGVFIKNWDGSNEQCSINQDKKDAYAVASYLKIPFQEVDFTHLYKSKVFDEFLDQLEKQVKDGTQTVASAMLLVKSADIMWDLIGFNDVDEVEEYLEGVVNK